MRRGKRLPKGGAEVVRKVKRLVLIRDAFDPGMLTVGSRTEPARPPGGGEMERAGCLFVRAELNSILLSCKYKQRPSKSERRPASFLLILLTPANLSN